ncbi:class II lanthipeptide, LchA2/BrtA2 family [Staphylococcus pseudintermedius]|uniref:class II lanthipeptide, LchA2/BrtA2 family n=1 Tax=Staphylococcus pseudintermedius TaxID=283734 RepID=UPI002ED9B7E3
MFTKKQDIKKDIKNEAVLKELSESKDVHGGTTVPCTVVAVTVAVCPTTKCSSKC